MPRPHFRYDPLLRRRGHLEHLDAAEAGVLDYTGGVGAQTVHGLILFLLGREPVTPERGHAPRGQPIDPEWRRTG